MRPYLKDCLREMVDISKSYQARWYSSGAISKKGHPHHPLYLRKDSGLDEFDMECLCRYQWLSEGFIIDFAKLDEDITELRKLVNVSLSDNIELNEIINKVKKDKELYHIKYYLTTDDKEMLFAKTLEQVRNLAKDQGNCISEEQVQEAFAPLDLNTEQLQTQEYYLRLRTLVR